MGIVALIAVPMIKDTIYSSREKAFKNSALGLIRSANEYYLNSKLTGESFDEIEFKVSNGKMVSGNKELVFNGKVPVGNSYVKIKSNGDVAINITDGEFYAVKDYDEIGVSTGTSEETALLREEIAKELAELKLKVESNTNNINSNKNELNDKINSNKAELETKINNNTSSITGNTNLINNLTNKDNTNNIFLKTYPVGSIYISTSSTNPGTIYGGTWERYVQGKTLVSVNESETEFSTVNKTGGEKTHSHKYGFQYGGYYSDTLIEGNSDAGLLNYSSSNSFSVTGEGTNIGPKSHNVNANNVEASMTASAAHFRMIAQSEYVSTLQPYITVYMWKRVS